VNECKPLTLGISRVPKKDDDEPIELDDIARHFANTSGLTAECAAVVNVLAPTLFLFSPYDDRNESWLTREQMVSKLRDLQPIDDSNGIFKTVLNLEAGAYTRPLFGLP